MKEYYIIGQDFEDGMKWYFIKDYTNEEQPVSHYDYTEDKEEAQVFESYKEALDTLMSVNNFQYVCISDGGDDFAPVENWKIAYYDESGALYDSKTGKLIVNIDGADLEESYNKEKYMKFNEARKFLNENGYLLEKKSNKTDNICFKIIQVLENNDWHYIPTASIPNKRLEFDKKDGTYMVLNRLARNYPNEWDVFVQYNAYDEERSDWDDVKYNLSYYDILDNFT